MKNQNKKTNRDSRKGKMSRSHSAKDTWEDMENFREAQEAYQDYLEQND